ncbi:hypothetical protein HK096_006533, partial [Nowakowskiella sp. JEL0078]
MLPLLSLTTLALIEKLFIDFAASLSNSKINTRNLVSQINSFSSFSDFFVRLSESLNSNDEFSDFVFDKNSAFGILLRQVIVDFHSQTFSTLQNFFSAYQLFKSLDLEFEYSLFQSIEPEFIEVLMNLNPDTYKSGGNMNIDKSWVDVLENYQKKYDHLKNYVLSQAQVEEYFDYLSDLLDNSTLDTLSTKIPKSIVHTVTTIHKIFPESNKPHYILFLYYLQTREVDAALENLELFFELGGASEGSLNHLNLLLNRAIALTKFENWSGAEEALLSCMKMSSERKDSECFLFCLSWLYNLYLTSNKSPTTSQMSQYLLKSLITGCTQPRSLNPELLVPSLQWDLLASLNRGDDTKNVLQKLALLDGVERRYGNSEGNWNGKEIEASIWKTLGRNDLNKLYKILNALQSSDNGEINISEFVDDTEKFNLIKNETTKSKIFRINLTPPSHEIMKNYIEKINLLFKSSAKIYALPIVLKALSQINSSNICFEKELVSHLHVILGRWLGLSGNWQDLGIEASLDVISMLLEDSNVDRMYEAFEFLCELEN